MKLISNLDELRNSMFGRPNPRHGLELLHWFSRHYINMYTDGRMTPKLGQPQEGVFGFCLFYNKEKILPRQNRPYYEVGNLRDTQAHELPEYVREKYTGLIDGSNKDRIMISLKDGNIEKVYVTEHVDLKNFNPSKTYEVSQDVVKQIRHMELDQFLQRCNPRPSINPAFVIDVENECINHSYIERNPSRCWCTIL